MKRDNGSLDGSGRPLAEDAESWFEAAFQQHWPRVYALLFRLVGDRAEAEDLALDTFWRLYHRPPAWVAAQQGAPVDVGLAGWLYRVASNLGLNALRARQRRQRYEAEAGQQESAAEPAWDPGKELERSQARAGVRRVLAGMKPQSARLLVLRYSGLSYAELAAAMKISPGSVGTLLARAEEEFERLYRRLEGE